MRGLRNTSDRLLASLMFFTRLPWWRIRQVDASCFSHAAEYWPFAGWITGGCMAVVFLLCAQAMPLSVAVLVAIGSRLLLTGALHEDGWADCCDGLGGGTSRTRILEIMKDSHIGTYGVIGLVAYLALLHQSMLTLAESTDSLLAVALSIATADVWGKCCASAITGQLPYARPQSEAKAKVIYNPIKWTRHGLRILLAVLPLGILYALLGIIPHPIVLLVPILVEGLWAWYLKRKIQGYTGDCCGAAFVLCEASAYLCLLAMGYIHF